MREILIICLILALMGCGGSLSDEQRKSLKKEMEMREIKKVSEEEIFKKGLEIGRIIIPQLNTGSIDAVARRNGVTIILADSLSQDLTTVHQEILEAYFYAPVKDLADNVQDANDTIIYAAPILENEKLQGVWFISIPRKKIVLAR